MDFEQRETLSPVERALEVLAIVMLALLAIFFVMHQTRETGFFTEAFGPFEAICLYMPLALGFLAPFARAVTGRRNPGRPFEALTSLLLGLAAIWLLITFPFDFSHLGDVLPAGLRFLLTWVPDIFGRAVLILQAFLGPLTAISAIIRFFKTLAEPRPTAGHTV